MPGRQHAPVEGQMAFEDAFDQPTPACPSCRFSSETVSLGPHPADSGAERWTCITFGHVFTVVIV